MNAYKEHNNHAFTLIELLVAIVIIGLLASIMSVAFKQVRIKTRDSIRLINIQEIKKALWFYLIDEGSWPYGKGNWNLHEPGDGCPSPVGGGWDRSNTDTDNDGKPFIEWLVEAGYFSRIPVDPLNDGEGCNPGDHTYVFYVKPAGYGSCPPERGRLFLLGITDMETSDGVHPESPGFADGCSGWDDRFEYFTGGFEF